MPISRERLVLYGPGWRFVSLAIRARAGGLCECPGDCGRDHGGRCSAEHGLPHPDTGSKVVLTVAHLVIPPGQPGHDDHSNLRAMCQRCHFSYDSEANAAKRRETRLRERLERQPTLFDAANLAAADPHHRDSEGTQ